MSDITFAAGLDDTRFVRQITDLERKVQQASRPVNEAFGRWGRGIEDATSGVRKMTGALSSTVGVVSSVTGSAALIAGTVVGVLATIDAIANAASRAAEQAEREARAREKVRAEVDRALTGMRLQLGEISALEGAMLAIADRAEDARRRLRTEGEFLRLMQRRLDIARELDALTAPRTTGRSEQFGFASPETARRLREELVRITQEIEKQYSPRFAEIDRLEQALREQAEQQAAADKERHDQRMAEIEEEGRRRAQIDAERAEAEQRRIEQRMRQRELDERSLDIEIMRARGLDAEADAARIRLDIERQIQRLRDDEGMEQADRVRMERKLRELERLQLDGLSESAAAAAAGAGGRFAGAGASLLGATFAGSERQIFGSVDNTAGQSLNVMRETSRLVSKATALIESFTEAGSVKVSGELGARLN
jgi:hypothetical protein